MHVHVNIGSNLGNKADNIAQAVDACRRLALSTAVGSSPDFVASPPVESAPWGFESANTFLNVGVSFDTTLTPEQLLGELQRIESEISSGAHRDAHGGYIDRVIDIDLIAATDSEGDMVVMDTPYLTLPHPRAHLRDFVLEPLAVVDPQLFFKFIQHIKINKNEFQDIRR